MSQPTTTVTVTTADGATTFVPEATFEAMRDERDDLRRLVGLVQMHLFERNVQTAVDLLHRHGHGPDQAKALRGVIDSVRAHPAGAAHSSANR